MSDKTKTNIKSMDKNIISLIRTLTPSSIAKDLISVQSIPMRPAKANPRKCYE